MPSARTPRRCWSWRSGTGSLGDGSTSHLEFATPIDRAGIVEDVLVTVGLTTRETLRGLVYSIERRQDFRAAITLIDEAPEVLNG